jgi:hypothetical protein
MQASPTGTTPTLWRNESNIDVQGVKDERDEDAV